jgi:hypothetical protein
LFVLPLNDETSPSLPTPPPPNERFQKKLKPIHQAAPKKKEDGEAPPTSSTPAFDAYDMQPTKEVRKPDNQLALEDKEMDEVGKLNAVGPLNLEQKFWQKFFGKRRS